MKPESDLEQKLLKHFKKFKGRQGLCVAELIDGRVRDAAELALRELENNRVFLALQYDYNESLIYAACIVSALLKKRPIALRKPEPYAYTPNPIYKTINEEFALFCALALLNIQMSHITDKTAAPEFVQFLCFQANSPVELLATKLKELCDQVPEYLRRASAK
jgi:hypothetical protein